LLKSHHEYYSYYYNSHTKQTSYTLPFTVKLVHLLHDLSLPGIKQIELAKKNGGEEEKQDDNDYGDENDTPDYIMEMLKPRS